jgi:hypothetical protein
MPLRRNVLAWTLAFGWGAGVGPAAGAPLVEPRESGTDPLAALARARDFILGAASGARR